LQQPNANMRRRMESRFHRSRSRFNPLHGGEAARSLPCAGD